MGAVGKSAPESDHNSWGGPSADVLDDSSPQHAFDSLFLLGVTGIGMQYGSGDDRDNLNLTR